MNIFEYLKSALKRFQKAFNLPPLPTSAPRETPKQNKITKAIDPLQTHRLNVLSFNGIFLGIFCDGSLFGKTLYTCVLRN